jgi:hypothetical protein
VSGHAHEASLHFNRNHTQAFPLVHIGRVTQRRCIQHKCLVLFHVLGQSLIVQVRATCVPFDGSAQCTSGCQGSSVGNVFVFCFSCYTLSVQCQRGGVSTIGDCNYFEGVPSVKTEGAGLRTSCNETL